MEERENKDEKIQIKADEMYTIELSGAQLVKVFNLLEKELEPFKELKSLSDTIINQLK